MIYEILFWEPEPRIFVTASVSVIVIVIVMESHLQSLVAAESFV